MNPGPHCRSGGRAGGVWTKLLQDGAERVLWCRSGTALPASFQPGAGGVCGAVVLLLIGSPAEGCLAGEELCWHLIACCYGFYIQ